LLGLRLHVQALEKSACSNLRQLARNNKGRFFVGFAVSTVAVCRNA